MFNRPFVTNDWRLISPEAALSGRDEPMVVTNRHYVNGHPIVGPFAKQFQQVVFGMGCFWGAERLFWCIPGVFTTAVGYAGGFTPNPNYREVCTGQTGHAEVVLVVFDPVELTLKDLLKVFWESHDPTQGLRQGNDRGSQYRSVILSDDAAQLEAITASRDAYQEQLSAQGLGSITTQIATAQMFYYAEQDHQQYLAKNPSGYCGLRGTGVMCRL